MKRDRTANTGDGAEAESECLLTCNSRDCIHFIFLIWIK